jgi:DNA-binding response OmpR family regulator
MTPQRGADSKVSMEQRGPVLIVKDGERTVDLVAELAAESSYAVAVSGARGRLQRNLRLLARLLADDGFWVEVSVGVDHARQRLAASPAPMALVTDVSLPSPDAMETARIARRLLPLLPLFFVTSYPCLLESSQAFDPPSQLFTKPLDYRAFLLALRRETRNRSGQIRRVDIASCEELECAAGADRDRWRG